MIKKTLLICLFLLTSLTIIFIASLNARTVDVQSSCHCCSHYEASENQNQQASEGAEQMEQANDAAGQLLNKNGATGSRQILYLGQCGR